MYQLFQNLEGIWNFQRTVKNVLFPSLSGDASGIVKFVPFADDGIKKSFLYNEIGIFKSIEMLQFEVSKKYIYTWEYTHKQLQIFFFDGENQGDFFFIMDHTPQDHFCGKDHYQITCVVSKKDEFQIQYKVSGPQKNYLSTTIFIKQKVLISPLEVSSLK